MARSKSGKARRQTLIRHAQKRRLKRNKLALKEKLQRLQSEKAE